MRSGQPVTFTDFFGMVFGQSLLGAEVRSAFAFVCYVKNNCIEDPFFSLKSSKTQRFQELSRAFSKFHILIFFGLLKLLLICKFYLFVFVL